MFTRGCNVEFSTVDDVTACSASKKKYIRTHTTHVRENYVENPPGARGADSIYT